MTHLGTSDWIWNWQCLFLLFHMRSQTCDQNVLLLQLTLWSFLKWFCYSLIITVSGRSIFHFVCFFFPQLPEETPFCFTLNLHLNPFKTPLSQHHRSHEQIIFTQINPSIYSETFQTRKNMFKWIYICAVYFQISGYLFYIAFKHNLIFVIP